MDGAIVSRTICIALVVISLCGSCGKNPRARQGPFPNVPISELAERSRRGDVLDFIACLEREFQLLSSENAVAVARSEPLDNLPNVITRQRDATIAALRQKFDAASGASSLDPDEVQLVNEQLNATGRLFDRLRSIYALPLAESLQKSREFLAADEGQSPIARAMVPLFDRAAILEARSHAARSMVLAYDSLRAGGLPAFRRVVDPYSGQPFELERTAGAVVLTSHLVIDRERFSMSFPALP